ncbi:hypothetical protein LX69_03523 [Breznakibacter xylanolyticus]|uniref:Uncharacterized protein n=1 Tax=Breznakibacter xylanolyticus TaxID=990 RepID=A0A2W7MP64_9BACT|nr:hypothetical protein [Breznakibacter xylanolyticus]PZX09800.1 hypothetical protein LX69_03523 [Breznakibacter xylanolyticus]
MLKTTFLKNPSAKWSLISLGLFLCFLFFTPITFYFSFNFWLVFIQAFICGFLIFLTTAKVRRFTDLYNLNAKDYESSDISRILLIPFFVSIILFFLFMNYYEFKIYKKIEREGVITNATIINGQRVISGSIRRKFEKIELNVEFKTKNGEVKNYTTKVDREIFESVSKGLEVEIKYLPETPEIFKLIVGNENVQKIKGISNRNLEFTDFEKIIKLNPIDISEYLSSISEGWKYLEDEQGVYYENILKNEFFAISKSEEIIVKGHLATNPIFFIPKDKILNEKTQSEKNIGDYMILTTRTFELKDMQILHFLGINKKGGVETSMIITKK